jgi:hypothetical protein
MHSREEILELQLENERLKYDVLNLETKIKQLEDHIDELSSEQDYSFVPRTYNVLIDRISKFMFEYFNQWISLDFSMFGQFLFKHLHYICFIVQYNKVIMYSDSYFESELYPLKKRIDSTAIYNIKNKELDVKEFGVLLKRVGRILLNTKNSNSIFSMIHKNTSDQSRKWIEYLSNPTIDITIQIIEGIKDGYNSNNIRI